MKVKNLFLVMSLLLLMLASCGPKDRYIVITGFAQGGTYTVKLNLDGNSGRIRVPPAEIKDSIATSLISLCPA